MSQQDQVNPAPSAGQTGLPPSSYGPHIRRLALPLLAVLVAFGFIALATLRWDAWTGNAVIQTTNDAYIKADLTRLGQSPDCPAQEPVPAILEET